MSAVAKVPSLPPQTASNTASFREVGKKKKKTRKGRRKIKDCARDARDFFCEE